MLENFDWGELASIVLNTFILFTLLEMLCSILKQITEQESENVPNNKRKNRPDVIIYPNSESRGSVYVIRMPAETTLKEIIDNIPELRMQE